MPLLPEEYLRELCRDSEYGQGVLDLARWLSQNSFLPDRYDAYEVCAWFMEGLQRAETEEDDGTLPGSPAQDH